MNRWLFVASRTLGSSNIINVGKTIISRHSIMIHYGKKIVETMVRMHLDNLLAMLLAHKNYAIYVGNIQCRDDNSKYCRAEINSRNLGKNRVEIKLSLHQDMGPIC